jgi:PAS domain S-box-containing protein
MTTAASDPITVCLALSRAIGSTRTVDDIYTIALNALRDGLGVSRSSILLFDGDGVMRFKAFRNLSEEYRRAVEGHTPWTTETRNPDPVFVPDVHADDSLFEYTGVFRREGIAALAFFPLVSMGRVIGKFMLYFERPHTMAPIEIQVASLLGAQIAFAVERMRTTALAKLGEERLQFALASADMATWEWDARTGQVRGSENFERVHGLSPGTLDGSLAGFERFVHPDDVPKVTASLRRAMAEEVPHEVEYRVVTPDGGTRWVEAKGRVEYQDGIPARMVGVMMAVSARKEAELARLAAAEEASRLKDEFLATLSHELRTPLNAILGWVQMLRSGEISADRSEHAIDIIGRNARLQARLIEDMLDISRIIAGKLEIERAPIHVVQLIDNVISAALPAAQAKPVELIRSVPDELPLIEGDAKRLHQALANVVLNAVKFTPPLGTVAISASHVGDDIVVSVKDSGVGVDPAFLPYMFDRFRQADSRSTRTHGGLGLGLAITQHLLQQHGGSISAASDGLNCGATITMTLPVFDGQEATGTRVLAAPIALANGRCGLGGSRIVVVDDDSDSRQLLAEIFGRDGAAVVPCATAAEALHALRLPANLLVADLAMPDIDGYELIRELRRGGNRVPAIAVSAQVRAQNRSAALDSGFDAYCRKPIEIDELVNTVASLLRA